MPRRDTGIAIGEEDDHSADDGPRDETAITGITSRHANALTRNGSAFPTVRARRRHDGQDTTERNMCRHLHRGRIDAGEEKAGQKP